MKGENNIPSNPDNVDKLEQIKEIMEREQKAWKKLLDNLERIKKRTPNGKK